MELSCILSLYLVMAPFGAHSYAQQETFTGTCDTHQTVLRIQEHGILHLEHNFLVYDIPLPTDVDKAWFNYKFGDEYAWLGNCSPAAYPYDGTFCRKIMTRITVAGGL